MARRTKAIATERPSDPPAWWRCEEWPTGSDWQHVMVRAAAEREPAVLVGGPRDGRWFWLDELESQVVLCSEMHLKRSQDPSDFCHYVATARRQEHPDRHCAGLYGRVFEHHEPSAQVAPQAEVPVPDQAEVSPDEAAAWCWQQLAPRYGN